MEKNKVLIIRFSSFGDIVQCSSVVEEIARNWESAEIHWVTRAEFKELVSLNKNVSKVISFDRKDGIFGLLKLALSLRSENYFLIYDAHNNLRSNIINLIFKLTLQTSKWITRPKSRLKRILLFYFKINLFPKPYRGIDSFLAPLKKLFKIQNDVKVQYQFSQNTLMKVEQLIDKNKKIVALVPSAAWPMKRWPLDYWKKLIELGNENHFYLLGGKEDIFCEDLKKVSPNRVINLAGKLSLIESCAFISMCDLVISADTGLLHVADVLSIKAISLMGPTAFGFTKSDKIKTLEVNLPCRPCTKDGSGKCSQEVYQKCMVDILPINVSKEIEKVLI